jgi:glycosyltransferase involved in cell wall biosynthesis
MKIFLVIPTLTAGGAERVISQLANNWSKDKSLEVHVILLVEDEIFYEISESVTIHKFYFPIRPSLYNRTISLIKLVYRFRKFVKKEKPEFVLSFMNKYNIFVLLSLLSSKINVFVSERDSPTEIIPKTTEFLRNLTYKYANGIITQTNSSKEFIQKETGSKNVIVIPNPIKDVVMDHSVEKEKIILNVGRLVEKKGQKYLIEAFSAIQQSEWKLVFLGDGHLRNELEELSVEKNLCDKIYFAGTTNNVDSWLNKASIFAFPSILEGFPNALAEAMCAGLPCVSFNCDTGPSELIEDGVNGFLVDVGDIKELTRKIELLINNPKLRNQFSIKALDVKNKLNSEKISQIYLNSCTNKCNHESIT